MLELTESAGACRGAGFEARWAFVPAGTTPAGTRALAWSLARAMLAARTGIDSGRQTFLRSCRRCGQAHGKPTLVGSEVDFSLSHTDGAVAVAVAEDDFVVGVDVERTSMREGALDSIVQTCLAPAEREEMSRFTQGTAPAAAFLTAAWTCKEAVLKAVGEGLVTPPVNVVVRTPLHCPQLVTSEPWGQRCQQVRLHRLRLRGSHVATVAVLPREATRWPPLHGLGTLAMPADRAD